MSWGKIVRIRLLVGVLLLFLFPFVVQFVIAAESSPNQLEAGQVVDGEDRAALIFVPNEGKAFRFPCFDITGVVKVNEFSKLAHNTDNISFSQPLVEPADIHVRTRLVLRMPARLQIKPQF